MKVWVHYDYETGKTSVFSSLELASAYINDIKAETFFIGTYTEGVDYDLVECEVDSKI